MSCMPGLESCSIQVLSQLIVFTNAYLPLERFINGFYYRITNFNKLEGQQL